MKQHVMHDCLMHTLLDASLGVAHDDHVGLADWIVAQKLLKNEYVDNPDFPDKTELRLYYMYDTTEWSQISENINEKKLSGQVSNLSGEDYKHTNTIGVGPGVRVLGTSYPYEPKPASNRVCRLEAHINQTWPDSNQNVPARVVKP